MRKDYLKSPSLLTESADCPTFWENLWKETPSDCMKKISGLPSRSEWKVLLERMGTISGIVIDGGCGKGEWTEGLRRRGVSIAGLDFSLPSQIANSRQFPAALFLCGDLRTLPFKNNSIGGMYSWGAFEHFEDGLKACLKESLRVISPGGVLMLSVPFQNARHLFHEWFDALIGEDFSQLSSSSFGPFYQWRFTPSELKTELSVSGFDVLGILPICFEEGISRFFQGDLGINLPGISKIGRFLRHIIPHRFFAHMLLGIGQKPFNTNVLPPDYLNHRS